MKRMIGKRVKIVIKIDDGPLLTYTATITHQDNVHISFIDREGIEYTHKNDNVVEVIDL